MNDEPKHSHQPTLADQPNGPLPMKFDFRIDDAKCPIAAPIWRWVVSGALDCFIRDGERWVSFGEVQRQMAIALPAQSPSAEAAPKWKN